MYKKGHLAYFINTQDGGGSWGGEGYMASIYFIRECQSVTVKWKQFFQKYEPWLRPVLKYTLSFKCPKLQLARESNWS